MTKEDADRIAKAIEDDWKMQGWTERDILQGHEYIFKVMLLITLNGFPIWEPKFSDMLRSFANALDLIRDLNKPKN